MNQPPYGPQNYGPGPQNYAAAGNPYAQQQYPNPYAAGAGPMYRQNVFVPYGATAGPLVGPTLRKLKLGLGITQIVAMLIGFTMLIVGGAIGQDAGAILALVGTLVLTLWYLLIFGAAIVNVIWLYQYWNWIPPDQRYTSMWKKYISPGTAVGFMFIPYFNIYWMFVVYLGIAEILERMRVQYPASRGPAKNLALMALIVPIVFFPAAPFLQYMFAKHVEEMAGDMHRQMQGAAANAMHMQAG
jgi:hypothetical protein